MNVGDTARIAHGPWAGFAGQVTALFPGFTTIRVKSDIERTFANTELHQDEHRTVTSEGGTRYACLDCPATSRNRPPTGPCTGDQT